MVWCLCCVTGPGSWSGCDCCLLHVETICPFSSECNKRLLAQLWLHAVDAQLQPAGTQGLCCYVAYTLHWLVLVAGPVDRMSRLTPVILHAVLSSHHMCPSDCWKPAHRIAPIGLLTWKVL